MGTVLPDKAVYKKLLEELQSRESIVKDGEVYYHSRLYDRARNRMVKSLRLQTVTRPPESYASLMAGRIEPHAPAEEQLKRAMEQCCDKNLPVRQWGIRYFQKTREKLFRDNAGPPSWPREIISGRWRRMET